MILFYSIVHHPLGTCKEVQEQEVTFFSLHYELDDLNAEKMIMYKMNCHFKKCGSM